ncbi:superoxide dismutase [Ostreibacterium oceani]|uniref:Superoxide dismutase n=1 Tax=Ostreibacterium oceani TaxID=2654998 RepID=A0A6N7EWN6_9GAMM|nr:superoxide dismutase [Ostreibacterium oceani]MPV86961.1 superoxide dismutase [Ostreibacterium oceani]
MSFQFADLPYDYNALEPYIDAQTMEIHYDRHHRTYYNNFVNAIQDTPLADQSLNDILSNISSHSVAIRNNAGGFYNHNLFWQCMSNSSSGQPTGELALAIDSAFGAFDTLKEKMTQAGITRFGSGFAWLIVKDGQLEITSTPNQDNPLMDVADVKGQPILALDVWEHAYYLKYQNKRPDYINNWWNVVNWDFVASEFAKAK